jgi:hypothetical protein
MEAVMRIEMGAGLEEAPTPSQPEIEMSGIAVLWMAPIPAEVEGEQGVAEVEQGKAPVMLPLQVQARVAMAVGPTRVMGIVERAKATAEVEESEEMRIGVAEMAIPGTGTIRGRGKARPQVK